MDNKIFLLEWENNNMVGGFDGKTLDQCFNTDSKLLCWSLQHTMELKGVSSLEIQFLKSHKELNELRKKNNIEEKPLFDEYLEKIK